ARYCHTIDSQDSAGWAQCFTTDGSFELEGWAIRARAALAEYAEVHAQGMRCRHLTLNCLYEVRGSRAPGRSTTVVTLATEAGYKIFGQGAYDDEMVREDGQWRIESYLGVPLRNSAGQHLGHLAVFDEKPMPGEPKQLFIFRIFA